MQGFLRSVYIEMYFLDTHLVSPEIMESDTLGQK